MVINGHRGVLPIGVANGLLPVASDSMRWAHEIADLLDIQVQEISRYVMSVAGLGMGRRQGRDTVQPLTLEVSRDRAVSYAQPLGALVVG